MKKDWVLTQQAFDLLLSRLGADRDSAAEKYEKIRNKLLKFFKWRGCANPEEYTDKTIDQVARRIAEGIDLHVTDPYLYFHGTALNLLKRSWREPDIDGLEVLPPSKTPAIDPIELRERERVEIEKEHHLVCLDRCLEILPPETVSLIRAYHSQQESNKANRKELAESLNIPLNALRIRVFRVRESLEKCVTDCVNRRKRVK